MRRFTATQHFMARSLDRKIELAKLRNAQLLALLLNANPRVANAARLELDARSKLRAQESLR